MAAKANVVVGIGEDRCYGQHEEDRGELSQGKTEKRKSDGISADGEPTEKKKFSVQLNSKAPAKGLSISLGNPGKPPTTGQGHSKATLNPVKLSVASKPVKEPAVALKKTSATVASVFNDDDDSDEEEMPPEAKMRMKNIGRNTPTAAGPNSFGKGRLGFCDRQKVLEREIIKQQQDEKDQTST